MARTIWKFPLEVTDYQEIKAPAGRLLHVAVQAGVLCAWAEVTPGVPDDTIGIHIHGTGHPLSDDRGEYLGTFMLRGGALVFHAYSAAR